MIREIFLAGGVSSRVFGYLFCVEEAVRGEYIDRFRGSVKCFGWLVRDLEGKD